MKIHIIQHATFEKPGIIETWANENGYEITFTHTYDAQKLPADSAMDFLIIMGGPQSPTKLDEYPYLKDEIKLIRQTIESNKPVLGICLGAQLIAESLGASTKRSPNKEVGAFPIELTREAKRDPVFSLFPEQFDVMHWHNDMPSIPEDGVLLAKSEGCPNQAFRYGDRVYGLQFHMEMTIELIQGMIKNCPHDLEPGKYIQSKDEILQTNLIPIHEKIYFLLNYLEKL